MTYINIHGNISNATISNLNLETNQITSGTILSLSLVNPSENPNSYNVTIPKSATAYGATPKVYINHMESDNYGYAQDPHSYFVWYTTQFNEYELTIILTEKSDLQLWAALLIALISITLVISILIPRLRV
jgi:hypothetical protein